MNDEERIKAQEEDDNVPPLPLSKPRGVVGSTGTVETISANFLSPARSPNPDSKSWANRGSTMSITERISFFFGKSNSVFESDKNLPIAESRKKTSFQQVALGNSHLVNGEKKGYSNCCICFQVILVLVAVVLVSFVALYQVELSNQYSTNEANNICPDTTAELQSTPAKTRKLQTDSCSCGSASKDEDIRLTLRDNVQFSGAAPFIALRYLKTPIQCLPEQAFSRLFDSDRSALESVNILTFQSNGMTKICKNAFSDVTFSALREFEISFNGLDKIPDKFLEELNGAGLLSKVIFNSNAFQTIPNNIFGTVKLLDSLSFNDNSGLVELPSALRFIDEIEQFNVGNCPSLISADKDLLENFVSGEVSLVLTGDRKSVV